MTTPLIHQAGDTARVPYKHPLTAHLAADISGRQLSRMKQVVFTIFATVEVYGTGLTDSELDEYYDRWGAANDWPACRFETPRKRRSDLLKEGLVQDSGLTRLNKFGGLEVVWVLSDAGQALIEVVAE